MVTAFLRRERGIKVRNSSMFVGNCLEQLLVWHDCSREHANYTNVALNSTSSVVNVIVNFVKYSVKMLSMYCIWNKGRPGL